MIGSEFFEQRIKEFIDGQAAKDEAFAAKVNSTKRTVKDCAAWMIEQLALDFKKTGKMGYDDSEIYGMALHFYDEPELKAKGNLSFQGLIMSNQSATRKKEPKVELTAEERKEARERAKAQYQNEQVAKLRAAEQKKQQDEEKRLAKLKEKRQAASAQYVQPDLFG